MTLRHRLTLWYGGLTALVLTVALGLAYLEHVESHDADVDAGLRDIVHTATADLTEQLAAGSSISEIRLFGSHGIVDEPHAVWLFVGETTRPVTSAGRVDEPAFVDLALATLPPGYRSNWTADGRARTLTQAVPGTDARLVAAAALAEVDGANQQLRLALIVLDACAVAFAVAGGFVIARRALRPVAVLTDAAAGIARSHDLARRVPVREDVEDELAQLARTFNGMLASVENAYAAQQRFVSDVSHELRTPLTTIRGNAELLAATIGANAEASEATAQILREAQRLSRLVHDLLTLARADGAPDPLAAKPFQADEVLMETLDELGGQPGPRVRVSAIDQLTILGERDRIKEVLLALLDNARRYTPADGSVEVSLYAEGDAAVLAVDDSGIGIAPEDLPHVFERFWRSDAARRCDSGGTGLGLAIARWIVERHGGTIAVEPRRPRGTRLVVRLPLAVEQPALARGSASGSPLASATPTP